MDDYVPMTREGYNRIKAEAERLERVEMPAIAEKIAAARAEGDLSENAEYHAQREAQGMLQALFARMQPGVPPIPTSSIGWTEAIKENQPDGPVRAGIQGILG